MTTALIFMYICAGIACLGIGLVCFGLSIAVLSRRDWIRQTFHIVYPTWVGGKERPCWGVVPVDQSKDTECYCGEQSKNAEPYCAQVR